MSVDPLVWTAKERRCRACVNNPFPWANAVCDVAVCGRVVLLDENVFLLDGHVELLALEDRGATVNAAFGVWGLATPLVAMCLSVDNI